MLDITVKDIKALLAMAPLPSPSWERVPDRFEAMRDWARPAKQVDPVMCAHVLPRFDCTTRPIPSMRMPERNDSG